MRLQLILPRVEVSEMYLPSVCPYETCQGRHFRHHQEVDKPLKDTEYDAVFAHRYECLRCKRTFRLYPQGVTRAQTSQRVKGLGVMLYLLGLSYGATSLALEALGVYMCKTSVYEAVQAAAEKVPGMKRQEVSSGVRTPALGGDLTSVKCKGSPTGAGRHGRDWEEHRTGWVPKVREEAGICAISTQVGPNPAGCDSS
jgi:transposase-like protein